MSFKYEVFDNKGWLYDLATDNYLETSLPKLFNGDILDKSYKVIESHVRTSKSLVGIFSTSQTQRFGKNKRGNIIYLISPLDNKLPSFLISYGGKLKGKIAVKFKFTHWEQKLPSGEIIDVIGNYNDENMINILMNHYNVLPKRLGSKHLIKNKLESSITRKNYNARIFSIDPENCQDIDDALSIETQDDITIIGVHIAQPICWITDEDIRNKMKTQFSTLYLDESRKDLWGENITKEASLCEGKEKPAYTTLYYYQNEKLIRVEDFPSLITNEKNLSYDNANDFVPANEFNKFTQKITQVKDYHDVVSYWMLLTNQTIGNKFAENGKIIPYRVNSEKLSFDDSNFKKLNSDIRKKFLSKKIDAASYSFEDNKHETLNMINYCHFTSPIRRLVDTYIHYYLTYHFNDAMFNFDIEQVNYLDHQTKKFHRELELDRVISSIFKEKNSKDVVGYVYQFISSNTMEVYLPPIDGFELGFIKVKLYHHKFDYLIVKEKSKNSLILNTGSQKIEYIIGQKINLKLQKLEATLPKNKVLVSLEDDFNLINFD